MSNNEIKIGDTVDCSGTLGTNAKVSGGKVLQGQDNSGCFEVSGEWSDGAVSHYVKPDQITRHVPAAPVVEPLTRLEQTLCEKFVGCVCTRERLAEIVGMVRAPVVERPKSVGDKLASEMTFREELIKAALSGTMANSLVETINEEVIIHTVDALIAAIDKERAK